MAMAIRPEWKRRPDMVLYSWAGAISWSSGTSWMPSMNVELLRRYRGAFAAISAVLVRSASRLVVFSRPTRAACSLEVPIVSISQSSHTARERERGCLVGK